MAKALNNLFIASFLKASSFLFPVTFLFYNENGLNIQSFLLIQGIFFATSLIFELPIGYISDLFSKKKLLILSYFIYITKITLWLFFKGYFIILFGEFLSAIAKIIFDNITSSYIYEYLKFNGSEINMVKYFGRFNFSLSIGTSIAAIVGAYMYSKFGSKLILSIEFLFILIAIILLSNLPNIKMKQTKKITFNIVKSDLLKIKEFIINAKRLKYYVFYSGLLIGISTFFSTLFQPLMKISKAPVYLFGIITFFNHFTRAVSSLMTNKVLNKIKLKRLSKFIYIIFILDFAFILIMLSVKNVILTLTLISFICITIALQLLFTIAHICRFNKFINSEFRSFSTSINSIIARTCTALILIIGSYITNTINLFTLIVITAIIFSIVGFLFVFKIRRLDV